MNRHYLICLSLQLLACEPPSSLPPYDLGSPSDLVAPASDLVHEASAITSITPAAVPGGGTSPLLLTGFGDGFYLLVNGVWGFGACGSLPGFSFVWQPVTSTTGQLVVTAPKVAQPTFCAPLVVQPRTSFGMPVGPQLRYETGFTILP